MSTSSANDSIVFFVCEAEGTKWHYVLLMPLPILGGLVNLIVWLAATIYRRKFLRQNYVYTCVTSTLLSNVVFLAFHLWDEIDGYRRPSHVSEMVPSHKMKVGGRFFYSLNPNLANHAINSILFIFSALSRAN